MVVPSSVAVLLRGEVPLGGAGVGPNALDHLEYALSLLSDLDVAASRKLEAVALLYRLVGLLSPAD